MQQELGLHVPKEARGWGQRQFRSAWGALLVYGDNARKACGEEAEESSVG